jgi:hypothetical protein
MTDEKKSIIDVLTEGRFWLTVIGALAVTQAGAAVVVPGIAEASTEETTEATAKRTGTAVSTTAKAINDHADHIEALETELGELRALCEAERDSMKSDMGEMSVMIDVLLDAVEGKHGRAYLSHFVNLAETLPARPADHAPPEPVARLIAVEEPVQRLPTTFEELQQEEEPQ